MTISIKDKELGVGVYSEKQFQCGASIAAMRLAVAMSKVGVNVRYGYEIGSKNGDTIRKLNPSVQYQRITPEMSAYSRESISNAKKQKSGSLEALKRHFIEDHMRHFMKNGEGDVAHLHNYSGSRQSLFEIANHKPLVWTMHDTSPVTGFHYRTQDLQCKPLEYPAKLLPADDGFWDDMQDTAFALVAPSQWLADYASASTPDNIIVRTIPNALPQNTFYPMDQNQARAIIGIPPETPTMLFFAGTGAWQRKNFEVLARALQKVPDMDIHILVVGGGADGTLFQDPRITVRDGLDPVRNTAEIVALYNAVDVFCISSLVDNLPNTVLEAITCGKPVLASREGGTVDMVEDNKNGWIFNPRDVDHLARKMNEMMTMRNNWTQMGMHSLELANSKFSREKILQSYFDLYAELVEKHRLRWVS